MIPTELRRRSDLQVVFRFALCTYLTFASGLLSTGCGEGEAGAEGADAGGTDSAGEGGGGGGFMSSLSGFLGGASAYGGSVGGIVSVLGAVSSFNKDDTGAGNNNQVGAAVGGAAQGFSYTGTKLRQREDAQGILANQGATEAKIAEDKATLDQAQSTYYDKDAKLKIKEESYRTQQAAIRNNKELSQAQIDQQLSDLYDSTGKPQQKDRRDLNTRRNQINQQRAANDRYVADYKQGVRDSNKLLGNKSSAADRALLQ